jgi:TolB protein
VRLTVPALEAFTPDWSPDGRRILFTNACCLPFSEVYVMRADGSAVRRVTHSATGHQSGFARFSPDGRRIVFMSDRAYPDACCNELYTARVDGSDVRRVTHTGFVGELADWGRTP